MDRARDKRGYYKQGENSPGLLNIAGAVGNSLKGTLSGVLTTCQFCSIGWRLPTDDGSTDTLHPQETMLGCVLDEQMVGPKPQTGLGDMAKKETGLPLPTQCHWESNIRKAFY